MGTYQINQRGSSAVSESATLPFSISPPNLTRIQNRVSAVSYLQVVTHLGDAGLAVDGYRFGVRRSG